MYVISMFENFAYMQAIYELGPNSIHLIIVPYMEWAKELLRIRML
jgi:hypothetical protein